MPIETIVVLVAVTLAFLFFAGTLAWGDFYTRNLKR
jgi:hypothetical protein